MRAAAIAISLLLARAAAADSSVAAVPTAPAAANGPNAVTRAYVTQTPLGCGAVHVVLGDGRDLTIAHNALDARVAPDGRTVGWLHCVRHDHGRSEFWMTDALHLWRGGRAARRFGLAPFGRGWGFRDGGRAVAVYFGSHHGPGTYQLLAVDSGRVLGETTDLELFRDGKMTEAPPEWLGDLAR